MFNECYVKKNEFEGILGFINECRRGRIRL